VKVVSLYLLYGRECSYEAGYRFIGSITCLEGSLGLKKKGEWNLPSLVYLLTLWGMSYIGPIECMPSIPDKCCSGAANQWYNHDTELQHRQQVGQG
jgi:hypothetical protein